MVNITESLHRRIRVSNQHKEWMLIIKYTTDVCVASAWLHNVCSTLQTFVLPVHGCITCGPKNCNLETGCRTSVRTLSNLNRFKKILSPLEKTKFEQNCYNITIHTLNTLWTYVTINKNCKKLENLWKTQNGKMVFSGEDRAHRNLCAKRLLTYETDHCRARLNVKTIDAVLFCMEHSGKWLKWILSCTKNIHFLSTRFGGVVIA